MPPYSIAVSDSITTTERIDTLANGTRRIGVFDSTVILENTDVLRAGARNISVNDLATITERIDELLGGARRISVSDMTFNSESVNLAMLTSPAYINRTINLALTVAGSLDFIVTKKGI